MPLSPAHSGSRLTRSYPVVRKNSIRLPCDRDVGTYLFGLRDLENPQKPARLAENAPQPD